MNYLSLERLIKKLPYIFLFVGVYMIEHLNKYAHDKHFVLKTFVLLAVISLITVYIFIDPQLTKNMFQSKNDITSQNDSNVMQMFNIVNFITLIGLFIIFILLYLNNSILDTRNIMSYWVLLRCLAYLSYLDDKKIDDAK